MLFLILLVNQPFQIDQVNYYYFTSTNCVYCRLQLPIIQRLQGEGFDFEILSNPENFKISAYPTIIIELVDYRKMKTKQIKLIGLQSYSKLKAAITKIEGDKR